MNFLVLFLISSIYSQLILEPIDARKIASNSLLVSNIGVPSSSNAGTMCFMKTPKYTDMTIGSGKFIAFSFAKKYTFFNSGFAFAYENNSSHVPQREFPKSLLIFSISKGFGKFMGMGITTKVSSDHENSKHYFLSDMDLMANSSFRKSSFSVCFKDFKLGDYEEAIIQNRLVVGMNSNIIELSFISLDFFFEYEKQFLGFNNFRKNLDHLIDDAFFTYGTKTLIVDRFEARISSIFYRDTSMIGGGLGVNHGRMSIFLSRAQTQLPFFGNFDRNSRSYTLLLTLSAKL